MLVAILVLGLTAISTDSAAGRALPGDVMRSVPQLHGSGSPAPNTSMNSHSIPLVSDRESPVDRVGIENDRRALSAFYGSAGGASWAADRNWLSEKPLSEWHGVYTGRDGRVELLVLPDNHVTGQLPNQIALLDRLRVLNLAGNRLSGSIPAALGEARQLQTIRLDRNRLSGRIPPELGDLARLQYLDLSSNRISGPIPPQLADLSRLQTLRIAANELSGSIPAQIGQLESLRILDLDSNSLRGRLPAALGELPLLVELSLSGNALTGEIPPALGRLPHLGVLDLAWNQLTGQIPPELADPPRLVSIFLGGNSLDGPIPARLGQAMNLKDLFLHDNALSGEIPGTLGNLAGLQSLYLNENNLTGSIPPGLGRIAGLHYLDVSANQLSGSIHPTLHRLDALVTLRLASGNRFEGCLPVHWREVHSTDIGRLSLPNCPFGLPGLDVVPGRLEPEFDPRARSYRLWIGEGIEALTVLPITAGADVRYLDSQGRELADANSEQAGFQLAIADLADGFGVRAISGDGSSEITYSISIERLFPYPVTVAASDHIAAPGNPDLMHNIPDLDVVIDGQTLSADFLSHFRRTGGIERWGYPTSEVLALEPNTLTQFYQRGVVDFHNVGDGWVVERRLAWDYVGGGRGGSPDLGVEEGITNPHPGTVSGPWGHKISNFAIDGTETGFGDFFRRLGGLAAFGFPKTDARADTEQDGTLLTPGATPGFIRQYFQSAVLEHHPYDAAAPVKLTLLGDTLRNVLVPGFAGELGFSAAAPLTANRPFVAVGVPTPSGHSTDLPAAAASRRDLTFSGTDRFKLRLFEAGAGRQNPLERAYLGTFMDQTTRYVWWLLEVEIVPRRAGTLRTPVLIRYFGPDGSVLHQDRLQVAIELLEDTERVRYSDRHPRPFLGGQEPGTYRVEASHAGRVVAEAQFELMRVPVPESEGFAALLQGVSWAGQSQTPGHREAELRLAHIFSIDPGLAAQVAGWGWMRADLTQRNLQAIQLLSDIARKDPDLARKIVSLPWLGDGISVAEWRILLGAQDFDAALAESTLGSSDEEPDSIAWQIRALRHLRRIEQELPRLWAELNGHAWFRDGINEQEAALLMVLADTTESDAITRELLEGPLPETRRISTSHSDAIDLTVVRRHSVRLPTNLMDRLELGIRAMEQHLGLPWPAADVVIFLEPDLNTVLDEPLGGFYTHDYIAVGRHETYLPTLYHELGHFYFFSGDDALWLQESGPEYLEHHARWITGALSERDWEDELNTRMEWACYRYGANTIQDYLAAVAALEGGDIRRSAMWFCHYQIGHKLLFEARGVLGEQDLGAVLNEVIARRTNTGRAPGDEEILAALRARAEGGEGRDLNRIITSIYGPN